MDEWSLLCLICNAANADDQETLVKIVTSNDFTNKLQAQDAALIGFSLTPQNIAKYPAAAKKLSSWSASDQWGVTSRYRHSVLINLIT